MIIAARTSSASMHRDSLGDGGSGKGTLRWNCGGDEMVCRSLNALILGWVFAAPSLSLASYLVWKWHHSDVLGTAVHLGSRVYVRSQGSNMWIWVVVSR